MPKLRRLYETKIYCLGASPEDVTRQFMRLQPHEILSTPHDMSFIIREEGVLRALSLRNKPQL